MKKRWLLLLLVPLLALTMISCDADMRAKLAETMGKLGSNVYLDTKIVKPNLGNAQAASNTIAGLGSGASSTVTTGVDGKIEILPGVKIDPPTSGKALQAQEPDDQKKLKDNLADAFNSPQQKEQLKSDLSKKVDEERKEAVVGAVDVINKSIDALTEDLDDHDPVKVAVDKLKIDIDDADDLTEGDLLLVQMLTNLISNSASAIKDIDDAEEKDLLDIVDDALFTAQVAEELSGASSIDFTGQLDIMSLLSGLGDGDGPKGILSRDGEAEDEDAIIEGFLGVIENLVQDLAGLMGLKKSGGEYNWAKDGDYRSFIANQQIYRGSLEYALTLAAETNRGIAGYSDFFDTSTVIKYLLAVIFTEANEWGDEVTQIDGEHAGRYLLRTLIGATVDGKDLDETSLKVDPDDFVGYILGKGETYVKNIFIQISEINKIGGILELSTQIDKFLTEDFDEFWENLTKNGSTNGQEG